MLWDTVREIQVGLNSLPWWHKFGLPAYWDPAICLDDTEYMVIVFGLCWNKEGFINACNVLLQHDKHTRAHTRTHCVPLHPPVNKAMLDSHIHMEFVRFSTHYCSRLRTVSSAMFIHFKFTLCADSRNCTVQGVATSEQVSSWGCAVALSVDSVTATRHKDGHNCVLVRVFNERRCQLLRSWGVGDKTRERVRSIGETILEGESRSTRGKPVQVPLCPQITHGLVWIEPGPPRWEAPNFNFAR